MSISVSSLFYLVADSNNNNLGNRRKVTKATLCDHLSYGGGGGWGGGVVWGSCVCVCVGGGGCGVVCVGGCGRSAHYHGSIMLTVAP